MRNLFIILLLVPITMFGQVKKEVAQDHKYEKLNFKLNNYIDKERGGSIFQLVGLGMLSYGFLSNYYLSKKNGFVTQKKEQNNDLLSGLGALTFGLGVIIPMGHSSNDSFYNNGYIKKAIYLKNEKITYEYLNSLFKIRDQVILITLNGEVYNAVIESITDNKVYLYDGYGHDVSIDLDFISSITLQD